MNKIISFCLYGDLELYIKGALENSKLVGKIYPGWTGRFYVEESISSSVKKSLVENGCEVIEFESKEGMNPMMTRFLPIVDQNVDIWISRDCDSRINYREKSAVDEWLNSNKTFHLMRDSHNHYYPIMGGMFGIKNYLAKEKKIPLPRINLFYSGGNDQSFLEKYLWPQFSSDLLCHDTWSHNLPKRKFLTYQKEDKVSWRKAYGVGIMKFLKKQKNEIFSNLLSTPGQINKDFPSHEKIETGIFVGQRIDENNLPIITRDTRWEYEIRGVKYE